VEYVDGGEARTLEVIRGATDISSFSDELEREAGTWAERYHLSKSRANCLRPFALNREMRVLDVGGGCGAITRYLGEMCGDVDMLEPMIARAAVARVRTRDLGNVEVFVGEINAVPLKPAYDLITVIGVLEYVGAGSRSDQPYIDFLRSLSRVLLPGGRILVAIENRLGVKYLAGAPEDHSGRPFDGLEGYRSGGPARTFSRIELEELFRAAGLSGDFYHAFPDYKMTRAVFSERRNLVQSGHSRGACQLPSPDWNQPREPWVDEESLWRGLVQSGVGRHFGNSLIAVVSGEGAASEAIWDPDQIAAFYTTDRRAQFAAETRVAREDGVTRFRRRLLASAAKEVQSGDVTLRIEDSEFIPGRPLLEVMADADDTAIQALMTRWCLLIESANGSDGVSIELVPDNIMVTEPDDLRPVDQEWWHDGYGASEVLKRGVIWLAHQLTQLTPPGRWPGTTVADVATHLGTLAGLPSGGDWLTAALQREAAFQAVVHDYEPSDPRYTVAVENRLGQLQELMSERLANGRLGASRGLRAMLSNSDVLMREKDEHIANLVAMVGQKDGHMANMEHMIDEKDGHIATLSQIVSEGDDEITRLRAAELRAKKYSLLRLAEAPGKLARKIKKRQER
jgi:SAM-dependent methyltransferase